jgi:hypothetical protein
MCVLNSRGRDNGLRDLIIDILPLLDGRGGQNLSPQSLQSSPYLLKRESKLSRDLVERDLALDEELSSRHIGNMSFDPFLTVGEHYSYTLD